MNARTGLPILHELAARWVFRRRLLAALGAEPDLFASDQEPETVGARAEAGLEQRHAAAARMAEAMRE